jgi:LysM repeat protein
VWVIGCLSVAVAGLIGGSVLVYGLARRIGPVESQVPANTAPILVLLEHPRDGASYTSDEQIGVQVRAVTSQPLASIQLWADGQLVQAENPTGGNLTQVTQAWVWTPGTSGDHTLVARALDLQGQVGTSNVVTLHVDGPATADLFLEAKAGDSLGSIAQANGVSLGDAQAENPGVDPNAPLPAGAPVYLPAGVPNGPEQPPAPPPQTAAPPAPAGGAAPGPNPIVFWAETHLLPPGEPAAPPAAPSLAASVQGCDVTLTIGDGAQDAVGLFMYRADGGSNAFQRIATLGPSPSQATTYTGLTGPADYYVSAFNSAGETPSDIVHAGVSSADCAPAPPAGIYIKAGSLHLPQPIPVAYVYLSADGGPWFRLPSDPHAFMKPDAGGAYPVGPYLPAGIDPGGWKTLSGHVWGWQGGQLVHVGNFDQSAPTQATFNPGTGLVSLPSKLEMCNLLDCNGDFAGYVQDAQTKELGRWSFRWTPQDQATTGGIFQVSDHPFGSACNLDPSQLLMTGPVSGTPSQGSPLVFQIDLAPLDSPLAINTPSAAGQANSQGLNPTLPAGAGPGGAAPSHLGPPDLSGLLTKTWISPSANLHTIGQDGQQSSLPTYYVRILPRVNNQVLCQPTNAVRLELQPGGPPLTFPGPPNPEFEVTKIDFSEPWFSTITNFGCVKVLENYAGIPPYRKGEILCPPPYKGGNKPWYEQMFSFVVDAINWISKAYQDAQNALVNFVADVIPGCNDASWCKTALQAGLKAGMAALGLPPSLPNFDQLVELGKGELTNTLAEYATDATGVPCDNTTIPGTNTSCTGLIRKGIDAMANEVKKAAANPSCGMSKEEAHQHGIDHGLCLPSGLKTQSVTSGLQPAQLKITLRRMADNTQAGKCTLELNFPAVNNQAVGDTMTFPGFQGSLPITGPLHGDLFKRMSIGLPDIQVGETTTVPFVLQPNTSYLVPGYYQALGQLGPSSEDYWNNWGELYVGAKMAIKAGGIYPSNNYYSDPTCVVGDQLEVGPLARPASHAP